jgi:purine-binding chemotaxis protein CheW
MAHEEAEAPAPQSAPDRILEAIERQREKSAASPADEERAPYLGFFLDSEVYGLPLEQLREVARLTRLRRVPGAPPGVAGLVNLRGEIICALDVRTILGLPAHAPADSAILVALRGFADPLGLVVDSIADIYSIDPGQIESPPATWPAERAACFVGTVRVGEGLMGLLDLNRLVKI